jgi:peroxiredoxin
LAFLRSIAGCGLAAALFVISGCGSASVEAAPPDLKAAKLRKAAPEFALKDSNGATVHISDYRGKVVVLDFWATWCGPCKIEIPWFMEFEQTYKDRGFAVVGISMDDDGWEVVKPYIQNRKMNYRVLLGDDHVGNLYGGVESLPTTFLIDREGRIAATHIGLSRSKDEFRNEIEHLLSDSQHAVQRAATSAPRDGGGRSSARRVPRAAGRTDG